MNLEGWKYQPHLCACDDELLEYLDNCVVEDMSLFHMGPGLHHKVGIEMNRRHCYVTAVTISIDELVSNVQMLNHLPYVADTYQVIYSDLYWAHPTHMLSQFDFMSLFHLGETWDPVRGLGSEDKVMKVLVSKLRKGGRLLLYRGSYAYERALSGVMSVSNQLNRMTDFKQLAIWQKR